MLRCGWQVVVVVVVMLLSPCRTELQCPSCEQVLCVEELAQSDCPQGLHLQENVMFGCCPACVEYLEYGQPCPGVQWEDGNPLIDLYLVYGEPTETDSLFHWPNSLVGETEELPCREVQVNNIYSNSNLPPLRERLNSVRWEMSRDQSRLVPVVSLPACRPDLICQRLSYVNSDCNQENIKDCQRYPPGQAPTTDTDTDALPDPFPICNAVPQKDENEVWRDEMDCKEKPCTCHHMDFTLWSMHQWGQDCSQQFWSPQCLVSGVYGPVQHKVNQYQDNSPTRWCSSPRGDQIYGREKVTNEQSLMNCGCSRKRWELEQDTGEREGRREVTLHCTPDGSWESLQCDKELCWCVNTVSGKPISIVVPESLLSLLPCYPHTDTETELGSQYLRKCEHRVVSVVRSQELLARHGTHWTVSTEYECDYDGSFGAMQCREGECHCYSPSGSLLGTYGVEISSRGEMSCGCARDKEADLTDLLCAGNGDYKPLQLHDNQEFCVDPRDGWRVSGKVPQKNCCLDTEYYKEGTLEGHYYSTGGYVLWDESRDRSYQCRKYEMDPEGGECEDCREDIMKCQM